MPDALPRRRPGDVRDAILVALSERPEGLPLSEIERAVTSMMPSTPASSIRSYLHLNTPGVFERTKRAHYVLRDSVALFQPFDEAVIGDRRAPFYFGRSVLHHANCFEWLRDRDHDSIHAVVTDPPYGLVEYSKSQQLKMRAGRGGVWRIPPAFDGAKRSPLPRFTVLKPSDLRSLDEFFYHWGRLLLPVLVPGANVLIASNPLLSYVVSGAIARAGFERRGEVVRLVMTMRGGDRPKAAHHEFSEVSVMPRSMWEPWLVFRKPIEGRVQDNLRKWRTGGFRRPDKNKPFGDVVESSPTNKRERSVAPHPSLKPQSFLRLLVRGALPLGEGVVLDPFAGSGSTLAAAEAVGYASIGLEKDEHYFDGACIAIPRLVTVPIRVSV